MGETSPPASPSPTASAAASTSTVGKVRLKADYGLQKVRLDVQVAEGSVVPPGTTTTGSEITYIETGPNVQGPVTNTCLTSAPAVEPRATTCGFTLVAPGDTLTVTQTGVVQGLRIDPRTIVRPPIAQCAEPDPLGACGGDPVIFVDAGEFAPTATRDARRVRSDRTVDVDVLANDNAYGAAVTGLTVTGGPRHGTVQVRDQSDGPIRYRPEAGFTGLDTFTYSFSTEFGTATATVRVRVVAPPAPKPKPTSDTGSATSGDDGDSLAATGAPAGGGGLAALGALLTGAGALLIGRRRLGRGRHGG